jgi:hypothetical protein
VTACPGFLRKRPVFSDAYGSRVARDICPVAPDSVPKNGPARAKILGNPRWRLARDSLNALSTTWRISSRKFSGLRAEGSA